MSDLLLVEAALYLLDMDLSDWGKLYTPLCSRALKVPVRNRALLKTTYDEATVLEPADLAEAIKVTVESFAAEQGRVVIRASGTEPVIRIYSEAESQASADALAAKMSDLLLSFNL